MLIGYSKQFSCQVLDHQTGNKVLGGILLRQDQKDCRFLFYKQLRIDIPIKADNLFQLRIRERTVDMTAVIL